MNTQRSRPLKPSRGFTLIEALIAMVVLAFGMLAIAGFQMNLSRSADVAKQRAEATRLAQEKIEEMRSFQRITTAVGTFAYQDLATGTDTPATTTNTAYTRTWTLVPPPVTVPPTNAVDLPQRVVAVNVTWTDRANAPQTVNLVTVIARTDPVDVGGLGVPTVENGILRRPFARNINIPVPAISIGGGRSKLQWLGASAGWLVFGDVSGDVVFKCSIDPPSDTDLTTVAGCVQQVSYLLTGFINDGSLDNSWPWTLTGGTIVNTGGTIAAQECFISGAIDQNNGSTIVGYQFYACLVEPTNASNPPAWTGKFELLPAPTGSQRVCRYSGNYTNGSGFYTAITQTLDNQNYHFRSSGACPTGTADHQP